MRGMDPSADVDEYLVQVPDEQRPVLQKLCALIAAAAPQAVESISYGIPTFKLNGRPLVYFGTAKKHFALYGISGAVREANAAGLEGYSLSKGTIRFDFDKPFPAALIKKLVKAQLAEKVNSK